MQEMIMKYIRVFVAFCFISLAHNVQAQFESPFLEKVDSFLVKLQKTNTDTNYIVRPNARMTLKLYGNLSGANIFVRKNHGEENAYSANVGAQLKGTIAASVNYRGISLGMSFNPAHMFDWSSDFEINVNSYGNKFGADFIFHRSNSFSGNMKFDGSTREVESGQVKHQSINANFYYVFNNKRFSYPAAFTQSYLQKRSAGSWMAGVSYLDLRTENTITNPEMPDVIKAKMIGLGGGYGYNWVLPNDWLVHASGLPTLVVWQNMNFHDDVKKDRFPLKAPNLLTTVRLAAIHYFDNKFMGITVVVNHSHLGQHQSRTMEFLKWRARFLVGLRF